MKAAVFTRYGGPEVVSVLDQPKPEIGPEDVLIRNHATTVNSGDSRIRGMRVPAGFVPLVRLMFGIFGPRKGSQVLGSSLAGEVVQVGDAVTRFTVGQRVVASMPKSTGAHAQFVRLSQEEAIAAVPEKVSLEDAASVVFGGHTALYFLEQLGDIRPGEKILVNGASGSVGAAIVQLAVLHGATVTGVCSSKNVALVEDLGASKVFDYTQVNFVDVSEAGAYDKIVDCVGNLEWRDVRRCLSSQGVFLMVIADFWPTMQAEFSKKTEGQRRLTGTSNPSAEDLKRLMDMVETGVLTPVIDSTFPLSDIQQAHARVDTERKRGNVVVTMTIAA